MATPISTITLLPDPPQRTDEASVFITKADASVDAQADMVPELNTTIGQMNTVGAEMEALNTSAEEAETNAAASAELAQSAADAEPFNIATNYLVGQSAIGSDGQGYRRINVSGTGDDPVGSVTGNWTATSSNIHTMTAYTSNHAVSVDELNGTKTLTNGGAASEVNFTLPAGSTNDKVIVMVVAEQYLRVTANGSETLRFGGDATAGGGYIRSNVADTIFTLTWNGVAWVIGPLTGSLLYDE